MNIPHAMRVLKKYISSSKAVATSNDFFKNLKITIEISEICLRFRSYTLVNLVATALEKN